MEHMIIGSSVRHYEEVGSTNDLALELAAAGAAEGTVVRADAQTAGRGRIGRSWNSGRGKGLYLTVILRPRLEPAALGLLSLAAGEAVRCALASVCGLEGRIKWPNDVLVSGRKIAGVLMESRTGSSGVEYIVLGIGINTDWELADREGDFRVPPTGISLETDAPAQTELLFTGLLAELDRIYRDICSGRTGGLVADVSSALDRQGRSATLSLPDRRVSGILEGITPDGGLILATESGQEIFHSGELDYEKKS